jgi:hypothetical protein
MFQRDTGGDSSAKHSSFGRCSWTRHKRPCLRWLRQAGLALGVWLPCIGGGSFAIVNEASGGALGLLKEQVLGTKTRFNFALQEIQIGHVAVYPKIRRPLPERRELFVGELNKILLRSSIQNRICRDKCAWAKWHDCFIDWNWRERSTDLPIHANAYYLSGGLPDVSKRESCPPRMRDGTLSGCIAGRA